MNKSTGRKHVSAPIPATVEEMCRRLLDKARTADCIALEIDGKRIKGSDLSGADVVGMANLLADYLANSQKNGVRKAIAALTELKNQ